MLQVVQHFSRRQLRTIDVGGRQQHGELITAQPRDRVRGAQCVSQARRNFLQHQVAGMVPERVVDFLEPVEVDQQDGEALFIAMRSEDRLLQPIEKQGAVGKVGERVVIRQVCDALIGEMTLAPDRRFAQFPLHGRRQPLEVVLHDVVVRAGTHRRDRGIFADRAGDEYEREIGVLLAHDREGLVSAEALHRVVGDDEVPLGVGEGAAQRIGAFDMACEHVVPGARECVLDQGRIIVRVLDL